MPVGALAVGSTQYLAAEIRYGAEQEGALHLDDLLTRRTRISIESAERGVDAAPTVAALVAGIKAGAPRAVRETKALLRAVPAMERDAAFAAMQSLSDELFQGPDAKVGMLAFREKRVPVWDAEQD